MGSTRGVVDVVISNSNCLRLSFSRRKRGLGCYHDVTPSALILKSGRPVVNGRRRSIACPRFRLLTSNNLLFMCHSNTSKEKGVMVGQCSIGSHG